MFRLLAAAVATLAITMPVHAAGQIEGPSYTVVKTGPEGVELRDYQGFIVAEVRVEADSREQAGSKGFSPLANYIFGRNRPGEKIAMTAPVTTAPLAQQQAMTGGDGTKIAMTAPVTTAPSEAGTYTVRFMMPAKWTMETLPKPEDDSVRLIEVPARSVIAARMIGQRTAEAIAKLEAQVEAFAQSNDIVLKSGAMTAGYDGPSVPQSKRRWEVMREVDAR